MIKGIIFDECLNTATDWGSIFKKAFPKDGVLCGMQAAAVDGNFELWPGYFIACGRVLHNPGRQQLQNTAGITRGYVRLYYRIDLSQQASQDSFVQGELLQDSSGTAVFPELTQEDINSGGHVYEVELAVFLLADTGAELVRSMRPAGVDELYLYTGEAGEEGHASIRRAEDGQVALYHRADGGSEIRAISVDAAGTVTSHGGFVAEGGLVISGNISQSEGAAAQLGRELTLAADADSKLKLAYTEQQESVEISITSDGKNYVRAIGIYPDGTVDVPIPAPSIGDDLSLNGNLKLNTRGKGIYSLSTALLGADKDGTIQLGSQESGEDAQRMELTASDHIAIKTIQPGKGWTDALVLDGQNITANRNVEIGKDYAVNAGGNVHVGGKLSVDGEFALKSLALEGTLGVKGQTTLGNLLVQSPDDKVAVFKSGLQLDGGLSLSKGSIDMSTTSSGVTAGGRQLLYLDAAGTGWLGSTDKDKAPAILQLSARDSVRIKSPLVLEEAVLPKNYTVRADVGFELAINGASENRFCARYLDGGKQNTVGLYTRTGGVEYPVLNIAGLDGDVSVVKRLSVPSLEIRGTDIVSAGGTAMKLCNNTGVYIRNRYDSSFADITAAGYISGGYKMARTNEGLDITKGNHLALRIRQSDGAVALPMTLSSTGAPNVYMSAGKILYMVGSSRRFKDNIADARADEILPSLRKLPVSTYTSTCAADDKNRVQIGGIAEEFYKVDKRFAIPAKDEQGGIKRSGGECVMENIDERALLYSLLLGWQEQDREIRELKRQMEKMAESGE